MKNIYLDHNIMIESLINKKLFECLSKKNENIRFLYSPAHMEEVFKVYRNENSPYAKDMPELLKIIESLTNSYELLPNTSSGGIIIKKESVKQCYERVSKNDTNNRVENDSKVRFDVDKKIAKIIQMIDKDAKNISNLAPDEIWNNQHVKAILEEFNNIISGDIKQYNKLPFTIFFNKKLSDDLKLKRGIYSQLKVNFSDLEYVIEKMFRILNMVGYKKDKTLKTSISATHDVTHAIYATACNKLISTDKRFVHRCKAVYYFLGVNTEVILCNENNIFNEVQTILND